MVITANDARPGDPVEREMPRLRVGTAVTSLRMEIYRRRMPEMPHQCVV